MRSPGRRIVRSLLVAAGAYVASAAFAAACGHQGGGGPAADAGPDVTIDAGPVAGECPPAPAATGTGDAPGHADGLVPKPRSLALADGDFALTSQSALVIRDEAARAPAQVLRERLVRATGYALPLLVAPPDGCFAGHSLVVLTLDPARPEPEGYALEIGATTATLTAATPAGLARASATLRQLFAPAIEGDAAGEPKARWLVPALRIDDAPAFAYRGIHLDVSRHFFSVAFLERYLDLLAAYKLNTFHFHLTDDQGWRLEIKKYPLLTQVGAVRHEAGGDYGGFYTQDVVRHLVAYAAARGITIVPEIELPGHATAALAAYPAYGCLPGPYTIPSTWGVFENVFCPSEETFAFLEDVLTEVVELFPSTYIHVGGDEVPTTQWHASAVAQAVMTREHLANEAAILGYFIRRIETFLRAKGRTLIGWDEIVDGGIPASAAVMAWRGVDQGRAAALQGHDVVMTPASTLYFDHYQGDPATEPPAFGGHITVADVYGFTPLPAGLGADAAAHIVGAQANLWSEYVTTDLHAEYMLLPRALALAEVLWTDDPARDYAEFVGRLVAHVPHLDAAGVRYARQALTFVPQAPYGGTARALPGTIQAEDYDLGGEGVAYHDTSGGNQVGQYRHDDVDIEATAGGGFDVGYVDAGEWLEFTVEVASAGSYRVSFRSATQNPGASFSLSVDGMDVSGAVAVPQTASWTAFAETSGPSVTLPAGKHVLRVTFGVGSNLDWLRFVAP
jgi:hexosaminidase